MARFLQGEQSDSFSWVYSAKDHDPTLQDSDEEEEGAPPEDGRNVENGGRVGIAGLRVETSATSGNKKVRRWSKRRIFWRCVWYSVGVGMGYWYMARYHPKTLTSMKQFLWGVVSRFPRLIHGINSVKLWIHQTLQFFGGQFIAMGNAMKSAVSRRMLPVPSTSSNSTSSSTPSSSPTLPSLPSSTTTTSSSS